LRYKREKTQPIGIFDSGVGGVSVLRALASLLPYEDYLYFGDRKNVPYGTKKPEEVRELVASVVDFLLAKKVKIIVVACNTATAYAIDYLRARYPFMDFVGMEPAVKPAALSTQTGKIGVLATSLTLKGSHFTRTKSKYAKGVEVLEQEGTGLVQIVESNRIGTQASINLLRHYLQPMIDEGIDKLVLGCTHYPFLINDIKTVIGSHKVDILDPAGAVARRTRELLEASSLLKEKAGEKGTVKIFSNHSDFEIFHYLCKLSGKQLDYSTEYIDV